MDPILTEKNIEKLLKGRQLYDQCRQAKDNAHASEKQVARLQDKLTQAIKRRDEGLAQFGITSLEEFRLFNNDMCMAALQHTLEIVRVCDHCKGYEGEIPCLSLCGAVSYYHSWTGSEADYKNFWRLLMHIHRQTVIRDHVVEEIVIDSKLTGKLKPLTSQRKLGDAMGISICPPGHGFLTRIVNPLPFDTTWNFNGHIDS
jgi:hypothetical protein